MAYRPSATESLPFVYSASDLGSFHVRALDLDADLATIQDWLSRDYARFWGMQSMSRDALRVELGPTPNSRCLVGIFNGSLAFMTQLYNPASEEVGLHYQPGVGDCGMHFIIAPAQGQPLPGFSTHVLATILAFIFRQSSCDRVVVEPDVRNSKIHPLNRKVGFRYAREIQLSEKRAWLGFCTYQQFRAALEETTGRVTL